MELCCLFSDNMCFYSNNSIDINISIDGIQEIAEFVRSGTKWSKFEKNWNKWFKWQSKIGKHQVFIEPHFVMHTLNAPFYLFMAANLMIINYAN